uniref:transmembrane protease serine 2-like n=1 Tax=Oncorhynchus gorbuscha TaxID=8017 RepID=UPI001EAF7BA6|nr:transmembrane protease serine 2-like [Oncorhynchus gorbuscha]
MAYATGNSVRRIISHEKYDKQTKDNDIALMKLNTPLTMSDNVRAVCLPNFGVNLTPSEKPGSLDGGPLGVVGWCQKTCVRPGSPCTADTHVTHSWCTMDASPPL